MLGALAFGAWTGFPVNDDALLVLLLRDSGISSVAQANANRPVCALLLEVLGGIAGLRSAPYVAIGVAFWALLAWQTNRLSRRLLGPETPVGALAALLVLAPILVSPHYTTVTTVFPANLPVSLSLAALMICLGEGSERRPLLALLAAAGLAGAAGAVSEYGVATSLAAAALLWTMRRRRATAFLLLGAAVGYLIFRAIGDVSVRPRQMPSEQLARFLARPFTGVFHLFDGLWSSFLGAYGTAAGAVRLDAESRSTILAALVGLAVAIPIVRLYRRASEPKDGAHRVLIGLALAVMAGLLPVVLANRTPVSVDPYESRYLIPVLPFAAIGTACGLQRLTGRRFRPWAAGIAAFLAGYTVVVGAFGARNQQRRFEDLGRLLQPLARASSGVTFAVCPDSILLDGADMTPKVTRRWTDAEARRVWVMPSSEARSLFGTRTNCGATDRIGQPRSLHFPREGPVSHLVWIPIEGGALGNLEPYCCGPQR